MVISRTWPSAETRATPADCATSPPLSSRELDPIRRGPRPGVTLRRGLGAERSQRTCSRQRSRRSARVRSSIAGSNTRPVERGVGGAPDPTDGPGRPRRGRTPRAGRPPPPGDRADRPGSASPAPRRSCRHRRGCSPAGAVGSSSMISTTSQTWWATASTAARATRAGSLSESSWVRTPAHPRSQCGAPSPVKAGIRVTAPASSTVAASASRSGTLPTEQPGRPGQCRPGRQDVALPGVRRGLGEPGQSGRDGGRPATNEAVGVITDVPVPYVALAVPTVVQPCPNRAACESAITAVIGTPSRIPGTERQTPKSPSERRTRGSTAAGISNSSSSAGDQVRSTMS